MDLTWAWSGRTINVKRAKCFLYTRTHVSRYQKAICYTRPQLMVESCTKLSETNVSMTGGVLYMYLPNFHRENTGRA